jgi:hypothetical protein
MFGFGSLLYMISLIADLHDKQGMALSGNQTVGPLLVAIWF